MLSRLGLEGGAPAEGTRRGIGATPTGFSRRQTMGSMTVERLCVVLGPAIESHGVWRGRMVEHLFYRHAGAIRPQHRTFIEDRVDLIQLCRGEDCLAVVPTPYPLPQLRGQNVPKQVSTRISFLPTTTWDVNTDLDINRARPLRSVCPHKFKESRRRYASIE